jgi:hypothetical protein
VGIMSQKSIDIYMGHDIGSHANPIRACPIGIQVNFRPTNGSRSYGKPEHRLPPV